MKSATVGTSPTLLLPAGTRQFAHIFNNSNATIFLCYDAGDASQLTINNGFPILPNQSLILDNVLLPNATGATYIYAIYAISAAGGNDVRIQTG